MKIFILVIITLLSLQADVGVLKKVIDGDTLHFTNDKCRILYIDTPESSHNNKAKKDAANCKALTLDTIVKMGKQSTAHAKTLVTVGKQYKYEVTGKDRYNRSLCVVYTPKGIFNELMVQDGYAQPFERYLPKEVQNKYHKLSQEAKRLNRGLWKSYNIDCIGK